MAKKRTQAKSWTFMVYMAGDNNLDPNGVVDLKEMKKIGSTDDVNIVAQFDRASKGSKRYFLRKGGTVDADTVATLGKANTGDPKQLIDFITWGVKTYPAQHYIIVLWNHGQGWDDTDIYAGERFRAVRRLASGRIRHALFRTPVRRVLKRAANDKTTRAILLDDDAKDFLDNLETKKVFAAAKRLLKRKVDILGMDACLMSMAEVGYQVRGSVAYTVGSEETEPLNGWPYDAILTRTHEEADDDAKSAEFAHRQKISGLVHPRRGHPIGLRPRRGRQSFGTGNRASQSAQIGAERRRENAADSGRAHEGAKL